jgi:N-acetylmuramoyl-L-alanine amidase
MGKILHPKVKFNGKTVALDDGHGLNTRGKETPFIKSLGRKVKENEFNEAVVNMLAQLLLEQGFRVLLIAPNDDDPSLTSRTNFANQNKADIYVSIHYNALAHEFDYSTASGVSIHIYDGQLNKDAGRLAKSVGKHLQKGTKQVWRGIKEDNFHVLRETHMPAILSENGFMDDEFEASLMLKPAFQKEVANEHFVGIMEYFGLAIKRQVNTQPSDSADGKLERGEQGPNVKILNGLLAELGHTGAQNADKEVFDGYTEAALEAFQEAHGLPVDGVYTSTVGAKMLEVIEEQRAAELAQALYKVQTGAFRNKDNAEALQKELEANGYSTVIIIEEK